MHIPVKVDYGVRALVDLAQHVEEGPIRATEIARTDVSPQAFRIGRSVGTQFHPEITPRLVRLWIGMGERALRAHGVDPTVMAARTVDEAENNRARSDALVDWFLNGA